MRHLFHLQLLSCVALVQSIPKSPFKGNQNIPSANCRSSSNDGDVAPAFHFFNDPSDKCGKDVSDHVDNQNSRGGQQTRVKNVDKVTLDCQDLTPDMASVDFQLNGVSFTVNKHAYSYDTVLQRNVWLGELANYPGYASIVWDNACDRDAFMFEVTLPTDSTGRNIIRSVPCSIGDGDGDNCAWLVQVNMDPIQEQENSGQHRQLLELSAEEEAEAKSKDADIELLRLMLENDGDAADIFHAQGGRKLAVQDSNGRTTHQYVMPSGRRLDDGSTVRVLWLYTPAAAAARGGEANIKSAISAALLVSNNGFLQSGINLRFEAAAILPVVYTETTHAQSLSDLVGGAIANVMTWRNNYAADVVQMIINASDWCGLGYLMSNASSSFAPSAFSVVYQSCLSYYSSPHEIGHNMGLDHDTENSSSGGYDHGYKYCNAPNLRSIMAYACTGSSSTRMPLFSSPSVYYSDGVSPTGNANTCDNARVLRENKYVVSNFRTGTGIMAPSPTPSPTPKPTAKPTTKAPTASALTKAPTPAPSTPKPTRKPTAAPTLPSDIVVPSGPRALGPIALNTASITVYPDGTVVPSIGGALLVFRVDVATAGYYPVSYMLSTSTTVTSVLMGIKPGYVAFCGKGTITSTTAGRVSLSSVSTLGVSTKYVANNSLQLAAGQDQYLTLCIQRGAFINLKSICIGFYC